MTRADAFPLGAAVTADQLATDPHALLAGLREHEPVSWTPALDGWLVCSHRLAVAAMRDAATFTVDDPRFTTARVIGPSMLSLDGAAHRRHREPFLPPFRPRAVGERFAGPVADVAGRLLAELGPSGAAELRTAYAKPLATITVTRALGLDPGDAPDVAEWYEQIVAAVTALTAGEQLPVSGAAAFEQLRRRLSAELRREGGASLLAAAVTASALDESEAIANAAVLLFGGIETTEGMIANALLHLLAQPEALATVCEDPGLVPAAVEESLRLEPAAAVVDRYATREVEFGGAPIAAGELVRISLAGANRDPAVFSDPDRYDLHRTDRRHLAFASGPHVCVGVHLARLEAREALAAALAALPGLRLDPSGTAEVRGLVFRKPARLDVVWESGI